MSRSAIIAVLCTFGALLAATLWAPVHPRTLVRVSAIQYDGDEVAWLHKTAEETGAWDRTWIWRHDESDGHGWAEFGDDAAVGDVLSNGPTKVRWRRLGLELLLICCVGGLAALGLQIRSSRRAGDIPVARPPRRGVLGALALAALAGVMAWVAPFRTPDPITAHVLPLEFPRDRSLYWPSEDVIVHIRANPATGVKLWWGDDARTDADVTVFGPEQPAAFEAGVAAYRTIVDRRDSEPREGSSVSAVPIYFAVSDQVATGTVARLVARMAIGDPDTAERYLFNGRWGVAAVALPPASGAGAQEPRELARVPGAHELWADPRLTLEVQCFADGTVRARPHDAPAFSTVDGAQLSAEIVRGAKAVKADFPHMGSSGLIVLIHADRRVPWKVVESIAGVCYGAGTVRVHLAAEPE